MTSPTVAALARLLPVRVEEHYGPDARVDRLRAALGSFAEDTRSVRPDSLAEVEAAAQSVFRHLELSYQPRLTPQERSPGWPDPDLGAITAAGADVAEIRRDPDGTATIRLTGLAAVAAAAPLLAGAFALVQGAHRLVLDLRANGGGDPATAVFIVSWLAGAEVRPCFDVRYRDRTRQWWTSGAAPVRPPSGEVHALIGAGTYSSGEALAWTIQRLGLATLIGQPTPGAADHVVPLAVTSEVHALIPEACALAPGGGPTWEGFGVQPDLYEAEH